MRLTEMILKVAQNCTLGYSETKHSLGFQFWLHLWHNVYTVGILYEINSSFLYFSSRAEDESATGLPIILVAGVCVGGAILAVILATLCILCLCVWRFNVRHL